MERVRVREKEREWESERREKRDCEKKSERGKQDVKMIFYVHFEIVPETD